MLSRLVITFLPRSKGLLISWLQSLSSVILEPKKIKICHCFHCFPVYLPWSDGARCHDLHFSECCVLSQFFHSPLSSSSRGSLVPLHFLPKEWYHLHIWDCDIFPSNLEFIRCHCTLWFENIIAVILSWIAVNGLNLNKGICIPWLSVYMMLARMLWAYNLFHKHHGHHEEPHLSLIIFQKEFSRNKSNLGISRWGKPSGFFKFR